MNAAAGNAAVPAAMVELVPPMSSEGAPESSMARWVGVIDETEIRDAVRAKRRIHAVGGNGYHRARLLVRSGALVRGFVDVPLTRGSMAASTLAKELRSLPLAEGRPAITERPSFTVVICTRDRATILSAALTSILAIDYPDFDVVVVDNASATSATRELVAEEFCDPRLVLVDEPVPGLAGARNTGLRHARGDYVAFTDDDVIVDPGWLESLAAGFARSPGADCVVGLVPSGELRNRVQAFFDERVTWAHNLVPRVFSMDEKPSDLPTFPFSVGQFGTGANFALRRAALETVGEFDTAFGVGTRTGGGEDIDMFSRILLRGGTLVVEPSAIVWHRHRADLAALRAQAEGYGVGLGAWITKLALDAETLPLVLGRAGHGLRRLNSIGRGDAGSTRLHDEPAAEVEDELWNSTVRGLGALELRAALKGPWRYMLQRMSGRALPGQTQRLPEPIATVPFSVREHHLSRWGFVAALAGLLGLVAAGLPLGVPALQVAMITIFVLLGPGAALRTWCTLPRAATAAVIPGVGLSVAILVPSLMAATTFWYPIGFLVVLAVVTIGVGLSRWVPTPSGLRPDASKPAVGGRKLVQS